MTHAPTFAGPHRRYNPLSGEWVLVSAQRTSRPWQGQVESSTNRPRPTFDPECYLCPGTSRAGGIVNDRYEGTYVFTNDFPALVPSPEPPRSAEVGLFRAEEESGTCRVVCFSPRHDLTLAEMEPAAIERVVDVWAAQTEDLGRDYAWVQVFENRGEAMGASNPHPHGQIWASSSLPTEIESEDRHQRHHLGETGETLLSAYAENELDDGERTVVDNEDWIIVVPYWAVWPFETLILPKNPHRHLADVGPQARTNLALSLKELLIRYDNLFGTSFPYSMGWHAAPYGRDSQEHWLLHAHVYPPLLRSATVRKFMVGYELLAEAQRDLTAESAAERLRSVPNEHYRSSRHAVD